MKVALAVDTAALLKDYKSNELHGDATYKGKRVRILGTVGEIKRDATNTIYVTLGTGAQFEVPVAQCFFGDEFASRIANISPGVPLVADCNIDGLMMNVLGKDCSLPDVTAYDACISLQNAGVVAQCTLKYWTDNSIPFLTSILPDSASSESVSRVLGYVIAAKDDAHYAKVTTNVAALAPDSSLSNDYVGSPTARVVAILPKGATPQLKARIKAVFDKLPAP